ncbi:uncharacterized protein KY384_000334 [Bacidia gigantensis]|uniref:uncharacterized protein n=1 Tax=Bacidia gigantensis TaxID=2732470 RepID=UPI001D04A669|nr:uncharacterized protein KY384_000334 [Bacidia gigantensis]KAG8526341.1 hypothetical protein KY384_000334 [Bacidia gigantensis]
MPLEIKTKILKHVDPIDMMNMILSCKSIRAFPDGPCRASFRCPGRKNSSRHTVVVGAYEKYLPIPGYAFRRLEAVVFDKAFDVADSFNTDPVFDHDVVDLHVSVNVHACLVDRELIDCWQEI